jgi:chorismate mutase/prephenate dehydratase
VLRERGIDAETVGVSTYRELATTVASGRALFGVLPVENAIGGTVREGYDLLASFELQPVAEVLWRTDHRLLGMSGAELRDVREVLAHPLVLAECGSFLGGLTHARAIPCEDTGVAAREVARGGNPAIAALAPSAAASIYGLTELAKNCSDDPQTFSRFVIFTSKNRDVHQLASLHRMTSLVLSVKDRAGALVETLAHASLRKINLVKLESKPTLGQAHRHTFYLDLEGDVRDAAVGEAVAEMRRTAESSILIGSYDAHVGPPIGTNDEPIRVAISTVMPKAPLAAPPAHSPFPLVSREAQPGGTVVRVGNVAIGDGAFTVMAGPCSVESREQVLATAQSVRSSGAVMLRGGAFKPRTSPYAFSGMGWEGVALLAEAGRATGMPTISEVMTIDQVERMAEQIDVLQIGARNMQNFDLLKAVGRAGRPVLLKRGLSATLDELLAAAEYILAEGNPNVILCERGIRTFEPATRNTLDLSAVPVLRERSHLPVVVDPSHGVGVRRWIRPLCRAAKAVGAHGIIVEVHPNPPEAKSDREQALTFDDFAEIAADLARIPFAYDAEPVVAL